MPLLVLRQASMRMEHKQTKQERCTGLQQYADIGGPRLTDAVPLTKKNAVDIAIAFRKTPQPLQAA